MQLSPQTIRQLCKQKDLIRPFREHYQHEASGLSGGLSCAGYDIHLKNISEAKKEGCEIFKVSPCDNKGHWTIPPKTGVLGVSEERFCIPEHIVMSYYNKSTLARWFLEAAATLAEPGWEGFLTLELYNATDNYIALYEGQPIGQVIFNQLDEPSESPYRGKYQNQLAHPTPGIKAEVVEC